MQSLPLFNISQHPRSIHSISRRLQREQTRRRSLKLSWRDGGATGSGGNGGSGGKWLEYGDDDDFSAHNFDFLAALTLMTQQDASKIPCYMIAEESGEEEEEIEEEESEMTYVKPPPKPKPMSLNIQPGLSWMLMLLLVSGGLFLWRRSRNRNTSPEGEVNAETAIQRTMENLAETHLSQQTELAETQETSQGAEREGGGDTPDFAKNLAEQDVVFDVDRDIKIEKQPSGIELANSTEESLPPAIETPPIASEPPTAAVIPPPPPAALHDAREAETSIEAYNEDLKQKDDLFPDERMSEKKGSISEPASAPGPLLISVLLIPDTENPEMVRLVFKFMETHSTKELEKEMCVRWVLSPTSQIDEGSNQSAATNYCEARSSLNAEAQESDSPLSEKETEDYDFEYLPKKYDLIEEDLGPPVKPTAVDFTQPSSWELEAPGTKLKSATTTDERTQTMQYLLSNAHLMTEALKIMESSSGPVDTAKLLPQMPNNASMKASKKSKKKKSKKSKKSASA